LIAFSLSSYYIQYSGDVTTVLSYESIETKQFLPRDAVHSALLAVVRYVCLSVRPSVRLMYCIETTEDIVELFRSSVAYRCSFCAKLM